MTARLTELAIAALSAHAAGASRGDGPESAALRAWSDAAGAPDLRRAWLNAVASPDPVDRPLVELARSIALEPGELAMAALALAVETDPLLGRVLAWLQAPVGGARPTLGLLGSALRRLDPATTVDGLATGVAVASGLVVLTDGGGPLPERAVAMPTHLILAAQGRDARLPGVRIGLHTDGAIPLPPSVVQEAQRHADGLGPGRSLVVRSGHAAEARAVAAAIAAALGLRPAFLDGDPPVGLVPWLYLRGLLPVFQRRLGPSERFVLPELERWQGPVLVVAGPDGAVEAPRGAALSWFVPIPSTDERLALWNSALDEPVLAQRLATSHRHGSGRIAELGRLSRHLAALDGRETPRAADVLAAAWQGDGGLESLAQPLRTPVEDEALVLSDGVRRDLDLLLARCHGREALAERLGVATKTRYATGVRALFVGPSGTGKTLAVSWLATRLALPLYRVDLASVVSKYIGETEKNLAELLARAESSEVVLFFDEADTLFGKRTDVRHSTDRFANSQTNYLLQRIESYDGVVVLASNSRARFDPAFSRRLDVIVDFPPPGPEERRSLWMAHLGTGHTLAMRDLNRLAAHCDLAGGHVRNAVLAAAVLAREAGRPIAWDDLMRGLTLECRKLGVPLPAGLEGKLK